MRRHHDLVRGELAERVLEGLQRIAVADLAPRPDTELGEPGEARVEPVLGKPAKLLVWTTTPWTLPSNLALAVGPSVEYSVFEEKGTHFILAKAREEAYAKQLTPLTRVGTLSASDLRGKAYSPLFPFLKQTPGAFRVLVGDFVSTEDKLGKPVANDLREGKLTLPLIYLVELGDAAHRRAIETVVTEGAFEAVSRDEILSLVVEHGTLDRARAEARRYAGLATAALEGFPDSEYRRALLSIPNFIVERDM